MGQSITFAEGILNHETVCTQQCDLWETWGGSIESAQCSRVAILSQTVLVQITAVIFQPGDLCRFVSPLGTLFPSLQNWVQNWKLLPFLQNWVHHMSFLLRQFLKINQLMDIRHRAHHLPHNECSERLSITSVMRSYMQNSVKICKYLEFWYWQKFLL